MNIGFVALLTCTLLVGSTLGTKLGQPPKPPCKPGFSQNFYTVIVSRDILRGQSILKVRYPQLPSSPSESCCARLKRFPMNSPMNGLMFLRKVVSEARRRLQRDSVV
ncbi:unnamed protein product [Boreogadus saida]